MASHKSFLLALFCIAAAAAAAVAPEPTVEAPAPSPEPLSVYRILDKGQEYTTLIRMLKDTQIGGQLDSQLNNSYGGLTLFAPTDAAFGKLKPGALNGLTSQQQVALLLYHILPRYYTMEMLDTASNPVNTQATGNDGVYSLNITSSDKKVNLSTGINETPISSALYSTFPLAIYKIDAVLLPYDLFGPKRHVIAKPPKFVPKDGGEEGQQSSPAGEGVAASQSAKLPSGGGVIRSAGWSRGILGIGLVGMFML